MTSCQVDYMDIIAYSCAVFCIVVISEDVNDRPPPYGDLGHKRHEVVGCTVGVLANPARLMGSNWIEIAEQDDIPLVWLAR